MVINQKMIEKKMGYRGSKSEKSSRENVLRNFSVKEQRINGSCCFISKHLRYILTDFERNYQVKILSNQINKLRSYSVAAKQSQVNPNLLNANFVTGFVDAEGCFMVIIQKNPISKT